MHYDGQSSVAPAARRPAPAGRASSAPAPLMPPTSRPGRTARPRRSVGARSGPARRTGPSAPGGPSPADCRRLLRRT